MKFNTLIEYPMTALYRTWEPEVRIDQEVYRKYADPVTVPCTVGVLSSGSVSVSTPNALQSFGILYSLKDPAGVPVMDEVWYTVMTVQPVFDAFGYISSYKARIAPLSPDIITDPIDGYETYPDLDQA